MGGPRSDRLALIELLERDGRVRQQIEVAAWPVTIGRGLDDAVVLDDPHVAAAHVRIEPDEDGTLRLQVADDARNPVQIGRRRVRAGERAELPRGPWMIGQTGLRVRWPGEQLPPERPLASVRPARGVAVTALLLWAMVVAEFAIAIDPGARLTVWMVPLLSVPIALTAWASLWGLMSKLFRHRFEFWPHVAIALRWALASIAVRWVVPMVAFALSWPWLLGPAAILSTALFFGMVRSHAIRVLPSRARGITLALGAALVTLVALQSIGQHQSTDRWIGPLYLSQLGPPALRAAPAVPVTQFIDEARALKDELAANAAADRSDEEEDDSP